MFKKDSKELISYYKTELFNLFNKNNLLHCIIFLLILIYGILARTIHAVNSPLGVDEFNTLVEYVRLPFKNIMTHYGTSGNHVFLSELSHICYKIFGESEVVIRLPVLLAGIFVLPLTYSVAKRIYNKNIALLSMGLVAISPGLIEYSGNARGYMLAIFFFMIILSVYDFAIKKQNLLAWTIITFSISLGMYSILQMAYPILFFIFYILLQIIFKEIKIDRKFLLTVSIFAVISLVLTFLLYSPLIKEMISTRLGWEYKSWKNYDIFFDFLSMNLKKTLYFWIYGFPIGISIFFILCFFISLIFNKKYSTQKTPLHLVIIAFFIFLIATKSNIDYSRFFLFLQPIFIILISAGFIILLDIIFKKVNNKLLVNRVINILIFAIIVYFAFLTNSKDLVEYNDESDNFHDVKQVIEYIDNNYPGSPILLVDGGNKSEITRYYINKNNSKIKIDLDNPQSLSEINSSKLLIAFDKFSRNLYFNVSKKSIIPKEKEFSLEYYDYWLDKDIYNEPKIVKSFKYTDLYELELKSFSKKEKIVSFKTIDLNNDSSFYIKDGKKVIINCEEKNNKIFSIPISLNSDKWYLISFDLIITEPVSTIYFDFYGGHNYDDIEQEYAIDSSLLNKKNKIEKLIYSGKVPQSETIYYRIICGPNEIIIEDLEITEIEIK